MVIQANKRNNHHFFRFSSYLTRSILLMFIDAILANVVMLCVELIYTLIHSHTEIIYKYKNIYKKIHTTLKCSTRVYYVINIKIGSSRISSHKLSITWCKNIYASLLLWFWRSFTFYQNMMHRYCRFSLSVCIEFGIDWMFDTFKSTSTLSHTKLFRCFSCQSNFVTLKVYQAIFSHILNVSFFIEVFHRFEDTQVLDIDFQYNI